MACQVYRKNKLVHQIYFIIQKFQNLWPKCSKKVPKVFRPIFLCFYTWIFWNGFTKFWKKLSDVLPILCPSHLCVVICSVISLSLIESHVNFELAHFIIYLCVLATPMTTPFPGLTTKMELPPALHARGLAVKLSWERQK